MHQPIPVQGKWLGQVVRGYFNYFAAPTNGQALSAFRFHVIDLWRRSPRRRSQKDGTTWRRIGSWATDWLPAPRVLHPWPSTRFAVTHAGKPHVRFLRGARSNGNVASAASVEPGRN
jgi:hypothetical protein